MKKIIFSITSTLILSIALTGCYNSDYLAQDTMSDNIILNTLPPEYETSGMIGLQGESNLDSDIFIQISKDSQFSHELTNNICFGNAVWVANYGYVGTYYYRIIAKRNDEIIPGNTQSFTVENNILSCSDPLDITQKSAILTGKIKFRHFREDNNSARCHFLVSTSSDFTDAEKYYQNNIFQDDDNETIISLKVENFKPDTKYYVKLCLSDFNIFSDFTIESNVIEFTTENSNKTTLQIGEIYGNKPNEFGEEVRITDNLKIVAYNSETGQFQGPVLAAYNQTTGSYVWKDGEIILEDGYRYFVYAFQDNITQWDNGAITYYGDDYAMGANWDPIYFGADYGVTAQEPYAKIQLAVRTCQVVVTYPASWGKTDYGIWFSDIYNKSLLPGSTYNIEGDDFYCRSWQNSYRGSVNGLQLSDDQTRYEYRFNIWPTNIPEGYVNMESAFEYGNIYIPCPAVNFGYGSISHIDLYGVDPSDVSVKPWVEKDSGQIIITPTN